MIKGFVRLDSFIQKLRSLNSWPNHFCFIHKFKYYFPNFITTSDAFCYFWLLTCPPTFISKNMKHSAKWSDISRFSLSTYTLYFPVSTGFPTGVVCFFFLTLSLFSISFHEYHVSRSLLKCTSRLCRSHWRLSAYSSWTVLLIRVLTTNRVWIIMSNAP